jgi:hypothetical protein
MTSAWGLDPRRMWLMPKESSHGKERRKADEPDDDDRRDDFKRFQVKEDADQVPIQWNRNEK